MTTTATINPNSERADVWRKILGHDAHTLTLPVKSPFPTPASLIGHDKYALVYHLDAALTQQQRDRRTASPDGYNYMCRPCDLRYKKMRRAENIFNNRTDKRGYQT